MQKPVGVSCVLSSVSDLHQQAYWLYFDSCVCAPHQTGSASELVSGESLGCFTSNQSHGDLVKVNIASFSLERF